MREYTTRVYEWQHDNINIKIKKSESVNDNINMDSTIAESINEYIKKNFVIVYFKNRKLVTYKWISIHAIHRQLYINDILFSYKQFKIQKQRQ